MWFFFQVPVTIPASDKIVQQIIQTSEAIVIPPVCALGKASNHRVLAGSMAAVRLPLLYVSNFKGGTPEVVSASYAILVLVLPGEAGRVWTAHEIEMVEVVADQVIIKLADLFHLWLRIVTFLVLCFSCCDFWCFVSLAVISGALFFLVVIIKEMMMNSVRTDFWQCPCL